MILSTNYERRRSWRFVTAGRLSLENKQPREQWSTGKTYHRVSKKEHSRNKGKRRRTMSTEEADERKESTAHAVTKLLRGRRCDNSATVVYMPCSHPSGRRYFHAFIKTDKNIFPDMIYLRNQKEKKTVVLKMGCKNVPKAT